GTRRRRRRRGTGGGAGRGPAPGQARAKDSPRRHKEHQDGRRSKQIPGAYNSDGAGDPGGGTMTETDWFACAEPAPMLEFLRGRVSERKLRLFAVTCCRGIWHLLEWPDQSALAVAERYADGVASPEEVTETRQSLLPMPPGMGRYLRRRAIWDAVWGTLKEP